YLCLPRELNQTLVVEDVFVEQFIRTRINIWLVEVIYAGGIVMGTYKINDDIRLLVFSGQLDALGDVRYDDLRALFKRQPIVGIVSLCLIFDEILRVGHLADVM